jgi:hypothetical protein
LLFYSRKVKVKKPQKPQKASESHQATIPRKNFFLNMETENPKFRKLFTGKMLDLIEQSMLKHSVFDGMVNHMCLFTSRPTRFFLVPGTLEHAYYAIIQLMVDHCEKVDHMILQIGNQWNTTTMDFNCTFKAEDGTKYNTVMHHSKVLKTLNTFAQDKLSSLNVSLMGYCM